MSKTIAATAVSAVLALGIAIPAAHAETTLNALFMAQAAYSEQNVRYMTTDFMKANPDIKVNLEFVPYEGLRDKTLLSQGAGGGYDVVLFDVIWPAEYATNNVLIDVSEPDEYAAAHAVGAKNAPLATLETSRELPKNKSLPLVIVCPTGSRAQRAHAVLRKLGYENARVLSGGLAAWRAANLPVDKTASA